MEPSDIHSICESLADYVGDPYFFEGGCVAYAAALFRFASRNGLDAHIRVQEPPEWAHAWAVVEGVAYDAEDGRMRDNWLRKGRAIGLDEAQAIAVEWGNRPEEFDADLDALGNSLDLAVRKLSLRQNTGVSVSP
jgi:hypothetical protein